MTLTALRDRICFYVQRPAADFVTNGTDILLAELNQARVSLEKRHNFKHLHDSGLVQLSASGVDLSNLTTLSGRRYKAPRQMWVVSPDGEIPVSYITKEMLHRRRLGKTRRQGIIDAIRYPGDVGAFNYLDNDVYSRLYLDGNKLYCDFIEQNTISLRIDCHTWNNNWSNYNANDWFCNNAQDFLNWSVIARINHFTQTFPDMRQEGTVSLRSVEKMIDSSIAELLTNENYDGISGLILP